MRSYLIAITGGIGSGKSVLSGILLKMGYKVYDCDSRAKMLIDNNPLIIGRIRDEVSPDVVNDGIINRSSLGTVVFNNPDALSRLNNIVHGAVKEDLRQWRNNCIDYICFVETAILYQSRLDSIVDEVWEVHAPENIRISRVMERNGFTEAQVKSRIKAQQYIPENPHRNIHTVVNDNIQAILPQIEMLLSRLR